MSNDTEKWDSIEQTLLKKASKVLEESRELNRKHQQDIYNARVLLGMTSLEGGEGPPGGNGFLPVQLDEKLEDVVEKIEASVAYGETLLLQKQIVERQVGLDKKITELSSRLKQCAEGLPNV